MSKAFAAFIIAFLAAFPTATHIQAVAASETAVYDPATKTYTYSYTYNSGAPTNSDVSGWSSGWGASGITGWDYVGGVGVGGASGVYLGNGYVLTAAHVGVNDFLLDGQTYTAIGSSAQSFGSADLTLFQINTTSTTGTTLTLPALTLASSDPTVGNSVVMIGYGNSQGERWGLNTVYENDKSGVNPDGTSYYSTDFFTADSFVTIAPNTTQTNNAQLVPGDSGGGDFIYNSSTNKWELAGINEVLLGDDTGKIAGSGMVQINDYAGVIETDMVPEPASWLMALGGMAGLGLFGMSRRACARI